MQPTITCKSCGHAFSGNYCNQCGEKVYTVHDKSVSHLLEEGLHFATHFEGKFFTTVRTIFTRPGLLSLDYCNGVRKKYFKPLSFFLLLVVIYLLFPLAQGLNMTLGNHIAMPLYGSWAKQQVLSLMDTRHLTEGYIVEHFHTASEKVSKLLLVGIIPVMALWAMLLTYKKRRPYFDHFILATEINSLLVLGGFLILPVVTRFFLWAFSLFTTKDFFNDAWVGILLVGFIAAYTFFASCRFYQLTKLRSFLFAVLFVAVYAVVVQYLYKFLLFFISIKLVH